MCLPEGLVTCGFCKYTQNRRRSTNISKNRVKEMLERRIFIPLFLENDMYHNLKRKAL